MAKEIKIKISSDIPKSEIQKIKEFGKMLKPIVKDLKKIKFSLILKTWLIKKLGI
jgi:hypothetical protein